MTDATNNMRPTRATLELDRTGTKSYFRSQSLLLVTLSTWLVLLAVAGVAHILDPLVRHDDFPALLLQDEYYFEKTLSEGRWFNYFWHLRGFETPAWLNLQVYLIGSATFAAGLALHATGTRALAFACMLSALIVLSPQSTLISLWFNTLAPGIWIIALYAVITLKLSNATSRLLLFVFVPISLQVYSTYPLMLFAVCLVRQDQTRAIRDLAVLTALFILAFAFGLGIINTLNYFEHGIFGIEMASWRNSNPLDSYDDLLVNLSKAWDFLVWTYQASGFVDPRLMVINAAFVVASLGIILRYRSWEALYILTGIAAGMGLLILHIVLEGITTPFRATIFLWPLCVIAIVRSAQILYARSARYGKLALIAVAYLAVSVSIHVWKHNNSLGTWQAETRALAERMPAGTQKIYVYGGYLGLPGAFNAKIQNARALGFRLQYLTRAETIICADAPEACETIVPPFAPQPRYSSLMVKSERPIAFVRLPAVDIAP